MRRPTLATLAFAGLLMGCGGAPQTQPTPPAPHNGAIVPLADGKGFAELVTTTPTKKDAAKSEFTVYFLGPDRATPLAPAPTSASLTLNTGKGDQTVNLNPVGDAFVSAPAPSVLGGRDPSGTLNVQVDGKATTIPLGGR